MRKKTVALGSLVSLLCATQVVAGGCFYKSGFLAGGHVGASFGKGTFNRSLNPNVPGFVGSGLNASASASKTSALFGVLGGYRHIFNEGITLGGDVSLNFFTNNELSKNLPLTSPGLPTANFIHNLKRTYSVIPSIYFGKVFCDRYHVSLGLGLGVSSFKNKVANVLRGNTVSATQTKVAFVPSINGEYAATNNISLVANVSYELYQKVSNNFGQNVTGIAGSTYNSSITPKYLTVKLGAVYRF